MEVTTLIYVGACTACPFLQHWLPSYVLPYSAASCWLDMLQWHVASFAQVLTAGSIMFDHSVHSHWQQLVALFVAGTNPICKSCLKGSTPISCYRVLSLLRDLAHASSLPP